MTRTVCWFALAGMPAVAGVAGGAVREEMLFPLLLFLLPALLLLLLAVWQRRRLRLLQKRCDALAREAHGRRERQVGLEALLRIAAKLGSMRFFLVAPDEGDVLFEAGREGAWQGRFQPPEEYVRDVAPEDREHFLKNWRRLLNGEQDAFDEYYHFRNSGRLHLVAERAEILRASGSGRRFAVVASANLSQAESRSRELADADMMFRTVFENLPVPLFLKDVNNDFTYLKCNPAFSALLGRTPEEVVGQTDFGLSGSSEQATAIRLEELEIARGGGTLEHDWIFPARDGRVRTFRFRRELLVRADGSRLLLGIGRELARRSVRNLPLPERAAEPAPEAPAEVKES